MPRLWRAVPGKGRLQELDRTARPGGVGEAGVERYERGLEEFGECHVHCVPAPHVTPQLPGPAQKLDMTETPSAPLEKQTERDLGMGRVDLAEEVISPHDAEHLDVNHVRRRVIGVCAKSGPDSLGTSSREKDLG